MIERIQKETAALKQRTQDIEAKVTSGVQKENERAQKEIAALKQRIQDIEAKVTSGGGSANV